MEKKMPYSADNNNSIKSRSCLLNFTTNSKMGFDEPNKTVNGNKHSTIWKLSEVSCLRNEETARATAGLAERKCLRNKCISKLDNELHRERSIPEIQKLKDVNWTELFLDQSSTGDSIEESRQSVLDHCIFKKMVQNNRGKDKKPDTFDPKLLHANIFNSSVAFVNNSENFEQETPGTLVNNNTLCPANIISDSIHAAKDKNENYFWAPLSESSDEEWTNVTKNNLKWSTMDRKKYKNLGDSANFDNPTIMKFFSSPMLEEEFVFKIMPDSCEKWNPGIETLQIQEYKCKNFTQTPKYEDFSGTQNSIKSNHEESKNGNINFLSKFTVQEDMLRDQMSDIQPLERASDQRNESNLQQMLEMDKIFKGRKYIREQDINFKKATYQKGTELTSPLDYPLEIKSSSVSSLLKPSENNTYKEGSDSLNHSPKGMNKSNSDHVLLVGPPQISDNRVIHKPSIISKNGQGCINDNISATGLKPADGAKEFLIATIKWDGHEKSFCSNIVPLDFSHSDGVLAKYYFYLNYLNESKRFRCENAHQFFFCQEHDFFKDACYDTGPCYYKNGSVYEEQTDENMNNDLGTSEGKKRTEIIKQQNHFEDQMLKPQFANSSPKQMERTGSFKEDHDKSDCSLTPWLLLPDELWLCIFSLLTHKDISQISQMNLIQIDILIDTQATIEEIPDHLRITNIYVSSIY
ncbi:hypothetical protein E2320_017492, partial [Naja naja]